MAVCALNRVVNRVNAALNASSAGNLLQPSFDLPLPDLGAGVVGTTPARGGVSPTFTRATAASAKLSTGLWKLDVASGVPRYSYNGANTAVTTTGGYFAEGARTQLTLNPRDMTQAEWVAVNVTPVKNAVGIDGVTNSACTLTSAAIGGSILQTLVAAASSRTYSVWLRRVSGTGTITISQGATTLDVTASLNSATFTRVELADSVLNSAYGITFGSSGDVIVADQNQFEAGAFASSPIPVATVTRNADVLTYPLTGWFNAATGTLFAQWTPGQIGTGGGVFGINDGTANERINLIQSGAPAGQLIVADGGVTQASLSSGTPALGVTGKIAGAYAVNDFALTFNAGAVQTDTGGTLPTPNIANIGSQIGGGTELFGTISRIAYIPSRVPNSVLVSLTS